MKNVERDISEMLADIDLSDDRVVCKLVTMKDNYAEKFDMVKNFDSDILKILKNEEAIDELAETLLRNDQYKLHLVTMEETLQKASDINLESRVVKRPVEGVKVKLPELEIKRFDGDIIGPNFGISFTHLSMKKQTFRILKSSVI